MFPRRCLSLSLLTIAVLASPALAEVDLGAADPAADRALIRSRAGTDRDSQRMLEMLLRLPEERGNLTADDLAAFLGIQRREGTGPIPYRDIARVGAARQRAQVLAGIMTGDLDGDGIVTRDEVATVLSIGDGAKQLADLFLRFDADTDDRLDAEEIARAVTASAGARMRGQSRSDIFGAMLDFDSDGLLTQDELERALAAFGSPPDPAVTGDADRVIRPDQVLSARGCDVPKPGPAAKFVVVTGYEGHALSSVTVDGQDGVTSTAELVIEPGTEPLYIVAGSYEPMVWRVSGAVGRVERMVVQAGRATETGPGAGVTGLAADRLTFLARDACIPASWGGEDGEGGKASEAVAATIVRFGRPADVVATPYTLTRIGLPSAKGADAPREEVDIVIMNGRRFALTKDGPVELKTPEDGGERSATERDLDRFHPGGVVTLDPKAVLSAGTAEAYAVLPQQAGLLQLIDAGLIQRRDDAFLVLKPIPRFPAGLFGAHSVQFILGPGVPMPEGDPGHSSVRDETRRCLVRMCR